MIRLWKKKDWFSYMLISAATFAVIVAAAVISPPRYAGTEIVNNEQIQETSADADQYIPASDFSSSDKFTAAKWVGDEVVFMSEEEAADLESRIYDCKTKEEYRRLMDTIVFYNKSIDIKRLSWYQE